MFTAVRHFTAAWVHESSNTASVLGALTESSLAQRVTEDRRSLGELAWHVVVSPRVILAQVGLNFAGPSKTDPMPSSLEHVCKAHDRASKALATAAEQSWSDQDLGDKVTFYDMTLPRGVALAVMIFHEIHHRGQMTVLMRQAGVGVPKIYG